MRSPLDPVKVSSLGGAGAAGRFTGSEGSRWRRMRTRLSLAPPRGLWKLPRLPAVVEGPRKARPAFRPVGRPSRRPPTTALENRRRFPTVAWKTEDGFPQFPQPRRRRADFSIQIQKPEARYAGQDPLRGPEGPRSWLARMPCDPRGRFTTSCEIAAVVKSRVRR